MSAGLIDGDGGAGVEQPFHLALGDGAAADDDAGPAGEIEEDRDSSPSAVHAARRPAGRHVALHRGDALARRGDPRSSSSV